MVALLMLSIGRVAAVTVGEDGGYDGVVVRVGAGVKEEHCLQLIRGLKTILDLGSSSLAKGLEGRAYLASVTLVLPPNWRDSMCGLSMASPSASMPWRKPDLLVETSDKMEVLQGAQCGQPGELVRLPLTQLLGNVTVEDGRRLARAWAGLRYGVFPEMEEEDSDRELFPNTTRAFGQQSVLCQGRAIREVILGHDDFKEVRVDGEPERNVVPQLVVVREPAPKVVLALETSSMMAEGESWRWIHKAAHRFLRHQLPVNSALALITFSGRRVTLEQPLIQVTSQAVRARLADTIPGKYHLATDTTLPCIGCVLEETVENVLHHDTAGAHLVLITSGKMDPEEQEWVEEQVARSNLQVSVISLSSSHLKFYDTLSTLSGGHSSLLPPSARGLERLHSLNGAFSRVAHEEEVEVHSQPIYTSSGLTEGTFVIDETLGRDTVFGILVEDEEDHLVRSVSFTDARGSAYGPYTKMSSTFDPVNLKTINYVGRAPPFGDVSIYIDRLSVLLCTVACIHTASGSVAIWIPYDDPLPRLVSEACRGSTPSSGVRRVRLGTAWSLSPANPRWTQSCPRCGSGSAVLPSSLRCGKSGALWRRLRSLCWDCWKWTKRKERVVASQHCPVSPCRTMAAKSPI